MKKVTTFFYCVFFGVLAFACSPAKAEGYVLKETFPRLMGMNIGAKNYHDQRYQEMLSRLDVVILGFYPGWGPHHEVSVRDTVQAIKRRNPRALIGQYTILGETYADLNKFPSSKDIYFKLHREGWWLRNATGQMVQWTDQYNTWMINFTEWTKLDGQGRRYPQWLAERNYRMYFESVPELDIWYVDGVNYRPPAIADWNLDGSDDDKGNLNIQSAFRRGHRAHWDAVRDHAPTRLLMGNTDNDLSYPEYVSRLDGAFLEGLMGLKWSIETWGGWQKAMERYEMATRNTAPPHLVGFNVWGDPKDYRFFRYAYASCLMGDGYFSFTDKNKEYSSVPWFDEYSIDLGKAIDPPQKYAWYMGIYKRAFEKGVVLVNPTVREVDIDLGESLYLIAGEQDSQVNNGRRVSRLVLPSKDGIILSRYPVSPKIYKSSVGEMRDMSATHDANVRDIPE